MKLQFIEAGEIVTTHGIRGEVKVLPWVDGPEVLPEFDRCRIDGIEYKMECRIQKNCNLVRLQGIDTVEQAQTMRGKVMELYREDMDDQVIFAAELEGVEVFWEDRSIGKVKEVLDYPGNSVYVIQGEYEYMIPAVKQFVHNIDLDANRMDVTVIEGMRADEN